MTMTSNTYIDCKKCRYFYITWDNRFPYGCKAFGFKSFKLPSLEVVRSSGLLCQAFQRKNR